MAELIFRNVKNLPAVESKDDLNESDSLIVVQDTTTKHATFGDVRDAVRDAVIDLIDYSDVEADRAGSADKALENAKIYTNGEIESLNTELSEIITKNSTSIANLSSRLSTFATKEQNAKTLKDAKAYTDASLTDLVGTAPDTLDTLSEIADALKGNADIVDTIISQIPTKVSQLINDSGYVTTNPDIKDISGSSITLDDACDASLINLKLYGKSTQDGTPTPDNLVDIVSVGDNGFDIISKDDTHFNLLSVRDNGGDIITKQPCSMAAKLGDTITFTVVASGEGLRYQWQFLTPTATEWLKSNSAGNNTNALMPTIDNNWKDAKVRCIVTDSNGNSEISNESTVHVVSDDCEITTASIATDALPLYGIPVESGGNYIDSTGQQWICDELIYNADGTGKIIKNAGIYTFTGNENFALRNNDNGRCVYALANFLQYKFYSESRVISDKFVCTDTVVSGAAAKNSLKIGETCLFFNNNSSDSAIYFGSSCTTLAGFKSEISGSRIIYPLAEPQEIELTASEMTALSMLRTFSGTTSISNSNGAEMYVKYWRDETMPSLLNKISNIMTGATSSTAGASGLVPSPAAGKQTSFLRGDGTWVVPTDTKVTNTLATTTKAYVTGTTSATTNTGTQVFDTGVYLETTAGRLYASSFNEGGTLLSTKYRYWRKALVGQSSNTGLAKPYYKFASLNTTATNFDGGITFKVSTYYSVQDNSTIVGILTAHFRTDSSGYWSSGELVWEYAASGVDTSKFILAHNASTSPTVVELWVCVDINYRFYHFDVISEGIRGDTRNSLWTLYTTSTNGSEEAITAGYTKIASTLSTLKNPISGNASTATALTTSAGSATQPVYFSSGKPVATTYTLGASVPADAVFTDTVEYKDISGSPITLDDACDAFLINLKLYGKSTQDGIPTPDTPIDIVSVGDNGFDIVSQDDTHFNLLSVRDNGSEIITKQPVSTAVKVGKTATFNISAAGDGIKYQWQYSTNFGTAPWSNFANTTTIVNISNCKTAYNGYMYRCIVTDSNGNSETSNEVTLYVVSDDCEITTSSIVTDALPLCGIPVDSDGNYTDSNGQQWICDELIYNADGSGKIIKRCKKMKLTSTEIKSMAEYPSLGNYFVTTIVADAASSLRPISNSFVGVSLGYANNAENRNYFRCFIMDTGAIILRNSVTENDRFTSLKDMQNFVDTNNVNLIYPLAEPQEIELTSAEVDALRTLQTFDGVTNISNDSGAEMYVKYWHDETMPSLLNSITTCATTSANGLMSAADKTKTDNTNVAYGVCETASATAEKVVTISGNTNWKLDTGSIITIKFTSTNTADSPTLNVNGTGARPVWYNGAIVTASFGPTRAGFANRYITYIYDGNNYVWIGQSIDDNTTYTNASLGQGYGTCATAETTVAKVVTLSGYSLIKGGIVAVKFTYAVPAASTMNINSKGAKSIFYRGAAITADVIGAGDIATFIYDGTRYQLLTVDRGTGAEGDIYALKSLYGDTTINVGRKADSTVGDHSTAEGSNTTASGTYSHAEGYKTTTTGVASHAEGISTTASGDASHAEGSNRNSSGTALSNRTVKISNVDYTISGSNAYGINSHAEGTQSFAYGYSSHAEGYRTTARGPQSHAEGASTTASGTGSHAEGSNTTASGIISHAEGSSTTASGDYSHAEGASTTASGSYSHAEGSSTTASSASSHAEGNYTTASGDYSHAEGYNTTANGITSHAEGSNYNSSGATLSNRTVTISDVDYTITGPYAYGINSHAEGTQSFAYGYSSHAEGYQTTASGSYSHAEGYQTTVSGSYSHAEGCQTTVSGIISHAEGASTTASGSYSHAEGSNRNSSGVALSDRTVTISDVAYTISGSTAYGKNSHAEGTQSFAYGYSSHAEGYRTTASGDYSHAEGNSTTAGGYASHAEGYSTASGDYSHAEGWRTTASGDYSHAEGYQTTASGSYSHAEGWSTTASGSYSHADGNQTTASGDYSHAEGYQTTATNVASHAGGHYNAAMTSGGANSNTVGTAFVIGNGISSSALSNAFSVQYSGIVKAKSTITASTTADYAEFFEWIDGNPDNDDRIGYFVTLDGDKIRIATAADDYILGVVSGEPFVLGNGDCDTWNGMFLRDEFRRTIYEPAPKMVEILDSEGNPTGEFEEVEGEFEGTRPKLNPEYDHTQPYISRFDRKEWAPVGMLGVLAVRHDGTAKVNGYVTVSDGGIATACEKGAENAYRVIKNNTDSVVEIVFR